jgi:hypothetical protein
MVGIADRQQKVLTDIELRRSEPLSREVRPFVLPVNKGRGVFILTVVSYVSRVLDLDETSEDGPVLQLDTEEDVALASHHSFEVVWVVGSRVENTGAAKFLLED